MKVPDAAGGTSDTLREDIEVARAAAAAARAVPVVARIATGGVGGAATYGRGEVVRGIVVRRERGVVDVEVHVTVRAVGRRSLVKAVEPVRGDVRHAVEQVSAGPIGQIDIMIDDLVFEGEDA